MSQQGDAPRLSLRRAGIFYVVLSLLGLAGMARWGGGERLAPGGLGACLAYGIGGGLLLAGMGRLSARVPRLRTVWAELGRLVGPMSVARRTGLAGLSGTGEELLFRGAVQPLLGIWVTSILFAALHTGPRPREMLPWTFSALLAGLLLGWIAESPGGLGAAILAHALTNYFGFGLVWQLAEEERAKWRRSGPGAG